MFYYKMKGGYHRYGTLVICKSLNNYVTVNDRKKASENSLMAYKAAQDVDAIDLPSTHPIR